MGLEPNGDWKRMQSAMLIADVTGDWMEGVVVAQLVITICNILCIIYDI